MAINKNHEFEELDGIKCSIVEKNASAERVAFLKDLLLYNSYKVVVVPSPPPKAAPATVPKEGEEIIPVTPVPVAETFTIGVTDVTFNPTNAIFGRLLHAKNSNFVTLAYWKQEKAVSNDEVPYFENTNAEI
ncbi:MAG: hypothetical protein ABJA78_01650 [Ferruginibacter sp.]